MTDVVSLTVAGLITATLLFLTASGLTLIFGVSRVLNLAHGSFVMVGAYLGFQVTAWVDTPGRFWVALVVVPVMLALLGIVLETTAMRAAYRGDLHTQVLVTVALLFLISDGVRLVWGTRHRSVPIPPQLSGTVSILGSHFPIYHLAAILAGGVVALGLVALIHLTRFGLLIRAAAQDRVMAGALGVDERKVFTAVFGLGSFLAGVAGVLAVPLVSANEALAAEYLILALVVVVVGGMGSVTGSLAAAVLIGLVRSYGTLLVPEFELIFVFATMALVLLVRPHGLLGRPE